MTTITSAFTSKQDCERFLSELLGMGVAQPGHTLVAYVDFATRRVHETRSFPTPRPVLCQSDEGLFFDPEVVHELNGMLCEIAQAMAPERMWTGEGWSRMTGELVTVVCREGEPEITSHETQYYWGWRYSNHLTSAFHGEVFAFTPQGWVAGAAEWSGSVPRLTVPNGVPDDSTLSEPHQDAEGDVIEPLALPAPFSGECLVCFVQRMMKLFGCAGWLQFARHYRDTTAPRATGLEKRLGRLQADCDCEIFLNGYALRPSWLDPEAGRHGSLRSAPGAGRRPTPLSGCHGVRRGSTQPCSLWWPRLI